MRKKKERSITNLFYYHKLNNIENTISKAPTQAEISHEEFVLISNETKKYCRVKQSTKIMEYQRHDKLIH